MAPVIARYVAGAVGAALLIPVFLLLGYVSFGLGDGAGDPATGRFALSRQTQGGLLGATLDLEDDRSFTLAVSFSPRAPNPDLPPIPPTVDMTMLDHNMGPTPVSLLRRADGQWQAAGEFSMTGRWRFDIGYGGEIFPLDVRVP